MALQPWELDVIDRGLTCLAALASAQPDWEHVQGQEGPALEVARKLNEVAEYQGYEGGVSRIRELLSGDGAAPEADAA
jgi:hypothetical protein